MQLLVIRHAIAEDRDEFAESGQPDDQRPLTKDGIRKMKKAAQGLKEIVGQIDHLATSPLTRAAQTAEIVGDVLQTGGADVIPALVPDARPEDFVAWSDAHHEKNVIAIVGHEPHLSSLIMWLVAEHLLKPRAVEVCIIGDRAIVASQARQQAVVPHRPSVAPDEIGAERCRYPAEEAG